MRAAAIRLSGELYALVKVAAERRRWTASLWLTNAVELHLDAGEVLQKLRAPAAIFERDVFNAALEDFRKLQPETQVSRLQAAAARRRVEDLEKAGR